MLVEISTELRASINGRPFDEARSVPELYAVMGPPSRIVDPAMAPVGHRNNQIHVYDAFGVYFYEHHYTRRVDGCTLVFLPEEQGLSFTPSAAFSGELRIAGNLAPSRPDFPAFLKTCPFGFQHVIAGNFSSKDAGYAVNLTAKGAKLRSGRRSKILRLVDLSLAWPHDPWAMPVS